MKNIIIKKLSLLIVMALFVNLLVPNFVINTNASSAPWGKRPNRVEYNTIVIARGESINQYFYKDTKNYTKKAKWSSSNKKIATVNSRGKIIAKKNGTVTITAKYKNKKYKCKVYVVSKKTLYNDANIKIETKYFSQKNRSSIVEHRDEKEYKSIVLKVTNKTNFSSDIYAKMFMLNSCKLNIKNGEFGRITILPNKTTDWELLTGWTFGKASFPQNISKLKKISAKLIVESSTLPKEKTTISFKNKKIR